MSPQQSKKSKFDKVLIANRGEIACRIIAGCKALGLKTVAVYSDSDAKARHVKMADESVRLGPGPAVESYLLGDAILKAAQQTGAGAIHPGYGFLSERSAFAAAVVNAGLVWIGPSAAVIDLLGNKVASKKAADTAKVPTSPWALLPDDANEAELKKAGKKVGYPLLLKAAAGGGGRGMRLVQAEDQLVELAKAASREAQSFFGSSEIFMESYKEAARHVEVQVLGDEFGTVVALGERDCTAQRRHQKVLEEAPAPKLAEGTRKALLDSAASLARSVGYQNAGTCEFLVDQDGKFYFLEMNTRLQVEHPVTELVWGIDLVALQLEVAQGNPLPEHALKASPRGHAIEARIYAEDASKGFMPSPGQLKEFALGEGPRIRIDTGYEAGDEIPLHYDAMLAKVIAWGSDREQARRNLVQSLSQSRVVGVAWNGAFLKDILNHPDFVDFKIDTKWIEREFKSWKGEVRMAAATDAHFSATSATTNVGTSLQNLASITSPFYYFTEGHARGEQRAPSRSHLSHQGDHDLAGLELVSKGPLVAEHPGKVLSVKVMVGQKVMAGDVVVVCESMKMEFSYTASFDTVVKKVLVVENQVIPAGTTLVEWEETGS